MSMDLSVIIPQYNELSNLKKGLLHEVFKSLATLGLGYEVIIVDDGSTDGSLKFVREEYGDKDNIKIIEASHGGKPHAILKGLENANGQNILFSDMDQSTPMSEITKLLKHIGEYEAVIGSRGTKRNSASILRKISGWMFSTFRKTLILKSIEDTQCGFKLFRGYVLKEIFPLLSVLRTKSVDGWSVSAFDVELLYLIERRGWKIKEVKVDWKDEDVSDTKSRKFFRESLDMLKQVLRIVSRELMGKYSS